MAQTAYQRRQEKGERQPLRVKIKKDDEVRVIAGPTRVNRQSARGRPVLAEGNGRGRDGSERHTRPNPSKQIKAVSPTSRCRSTFRT